MNSIKINYTPVEGDQLTGQSKWWGQVDMPEGMEHPMIPYNDEYGDDPLTLVCQIRCADLAPFDTENLLPHEGILYFFADIDYYVGAMHKEKPTEDEEEPIEEEEDPVNDENEESYYEEDDERPWYHNGMGEWSPETFKVIYSPTEEELRTHRIMGADGEPYELPAEKITFEPCDPGTLDTRLLGYPFEVEVEQEFPGYISLLQIWEEDRWCFFMYDCGILNFLILPEDLKARRFDRVRLYLHSC